MTYIDCKNIAQKWKDEIKAKNYVACLCVVQVGDDPASNAYIKGKRKDAEELGFICEHRHIPATNRNDVLNTLIRVLIELSATPRYDGIIVQQPLPFGIQFDEIKNFIKPCKDVDGFLAGSPFAPCTPEGIMELLREIGITPKGKKCVIIGRSEIVGAPLAQMLLAADATVTVCHSKTPQEMLKNEVSFADIVISATGYHGVISTENCKENAIIIDVGINRTDLGLLGDVAIRETDRVYITPVPGGVGLLTRAMLMRHVARAYEINHMGEENV